MGWRIVVLILFLFVLIVLINYLEAIGQLSIGAMAAVFLFCVLVTYFIVRKKI